MFEISHFAQLLVNLLAVGGGFLAGYILTMFVTVLFDRTLFQKKSPKGLHKLLRFLGGLIAAILVALIVFGHGQGWNLFGGASVGTGTNDGQNAVHPISTTITKPDPNETTDPVTPKPSPIPTERIRVTLLGGSDVKEKKFYRIDDDPTPRTFEDVTKVIREKVDPLTVKPAVEVLFAKQNRLPQDHPAVARLSKWVRDVAGLTVTFPPDSK